MKQPETKFKEKVRARLDQIPQSYWIKIQMLSIRGIPDFIGVVRGHFVALELKVGRNKVGAKSLQAFVIQAIRSAGGYAKECRPENLEEILDEIHNL